MRSALNSGQVTKLPGSEGLFGPRWSPDGSMIAALERDGERRLMLYHVPSNKWSVLSDDRADWPSWNKRGRAILFRSGDLLKQIDVISLRVENLTTLKSEDSGGFTHAIGRALDDSATRTLNRDARQLYDLYFQGR